MKSLTISGSIDNSSMEVLLPQVLLVDDQSFQITALSLLLQAYDVESDSALGGMEALEKI